jgi:hypothetical protein
MISDSQTLYRPVGLKEMELILTADNKGFPPRLPEQPFFYPVLNVEYANQIARDWNTKESKSGFAGFVTQFNIEPDYLKQFEVHTVGSSTHRELWIPAEQLEEFNQQIQGFIKLTEAYYGEEYKGIKHWRNDWYVDEMFNSFYQLRWQGGMDFWGELGTNWKAVLLNFKYWLTHDYRSIVLYAGEQKAFLKFLSEVWTTKFPTIPLLGIELLEP